MRECERERAKECEMRERERVSARVRKWERVREWEMRERERVRE